MFCLVQEHVAGVAMVAMVAELGCGCESLLDPILTSSLFITMRPNCVAHAEDSKDRD